MKISSSAARSGARPQGEPSISTVSLRCFRAWPSGGGKKPARCPAASSRCWRSAAASWAIRNSSLDEPSLGLAPLIVELVFSAIVKLRNSGITILLIEQNVAESLVVADDAAVLENGAVVLAGRAETVLADEGIKSAYLGL